MKLFRKFMAGAMAIAMLSAYVVAFATSSASGITADSGAATVTGAGTYAGKAGYVFLMKLPTLDAASSALAFTVDPEEVIHNSPPTNAISPDSTYGTVIFSTVSGDTAPNKIYKAESEPLTVISMSSVDVTVNMIATLTDTKMTLSTTSGFTGTDKDSHLYLGVQVATISGGDGGQAVASGGAIPIDALSATRADVLKKVAGNFVSDETGNSIVSGAPANATVAQNMGALANIDEDSWNGVQYTVTGASNPNANWEIDGLDAPNLSITWKIDTSRDITYDPGELPTSTEYNAKLDKAKYKAGDLVTLYVQPLSDDDEVALDEVTFEYTYLDSDGKMEDVKEVENITISSTPVNGVYTATFTWPSDMAKSTSPAGDLDEFEEPVWAIDVG